MNVRDLYSTRIQKTFDEDHDEIVAIFKANPRANLKLINYYKGLPLNYSATIAGIDRGVLDLDLQAEQAFTVEHGRYVFIRSPLFKFDLFAQAQYVNVRKKAASFVKFCYVEVMAERRNFLRLELDHPAEVRMTTPSGLLEGKLYDLSLSGLNVAVQDYAPLESGSDVVITFSLLDSEHQESFNLNLPTRLISIADTERPYCYKFAMTPDKTVERQLSKFIFQRQIEIIREIKDAVL